MVDFLNESEGDRSKPKFTAEPVLEQQRLIEIESSVDPRSQTLLSQWASPPEPISQILDAPATPAVLISPVNQWLVELEQPALTTIVELAEPVIAVAGFRLTPRLSSPARHHTYRGMRLRTIPTGTNKAIALSDDARISYVRWSPDGQNLAFALTKATGLEL